MTPFMVRVARITGNAFRTDELPAPGTRPSAPTSAGVGADRHVALRALAEQLVCEANAVLALDAGDHRLCLADEVSADELAFTVRYRGRSARVSTRFADGTAYGRLLTAGAVGTPHELQGPDALPDLLVLLLLEPGDPEPHPGV